ncbi:XdhC family protein [Halosimplex pelagicum]|uniref:XdhC family protein n=1 Tax=Halosimplex pelagicum TaxID=869886 RepID=A0A7D5STS2_9EURY|nr:XdhC/CoxI family protein [Halosimplex pelagicum]QLH80707.1 XdhC family protein [Halosimplex pelagicum]
MTGDRVQSDWSAPEPAVRATAREYLDSGEPAVLATVVAVDGRAYRRPGAKMVVAPDGGAAGGESGTHAGAESDPDSTGAGSVTAGCLADSVVDLASDVLADGSARVERFDLRSDETWGLGVGCDGVVDLLLEPLGERHRPLVATADELDGGRTTAVAVESEDDRVAVGDRWIEGGAVGADGASGSDGERGDGESDAAGSLPPAVVAAVPDDVDGTRSVRAETGGGTVRLFVERLAPAPRLVVVGSNADVRPVVESARSAGFRVTVVGFRGGRATSDRFPRADRVVATSPRDLRGAVDFGPEDSVVLMTHNFVDDRVAFGELLDTPVGYIGVLGPAERFDRLRAALADDGVELDERDRDRIYAPVGLDLGGGSPAQVAHSVVAEVLAVRNGRSGGHLRAGDGPIHSRDA